VASTGPSGLSSTSLSCRARTPAPHLTIALDFEGHGIGKLLVPLVVRREARREMPVNVATLKQRLEGPA